MSFGIGHPVILSRFNPCFYHPQPLPKGGAETGTDGEQRSGDLMIIFLMLAFPESFFFSFFWKLRLWNEMPVSQDLCHQISDV